MKRILTASVALLLCAVSVQADILAQYDFTLNTASIDSDPNSSAGLFTTGTGVTGTIQTNQGSNASNPSFGTSLSDINAPRRRLRS